MSEHRIWEQAMKVAKAEPCPPMQGHHVRFPRAVNELTDDREAIRKALKESRMGHTVRVTSKLP